MNILDKFKKYRVPISNEKMQDFCLPKKFKLQPQQLFLADYLSSKYSPWVLYDNIRGVLLYHQIGAGKTCTAISIAEKFKTKLHIMVILPAALIGNFVDELRSECTGEEYVTKSERKELKNLSHDNLLYKKIIDKINYRINKVYHILSYHKFVSLIQDNQIKNLNNTLLIIDEIQNMISLSGTFYKLLTRVINDSNDTLKLVLLSATPMFDKPVEIALTLNLLKKNDLLPLYKFNQTYINCEKTQAGINYSIINIPEFKNKIKNLISYYRGAPPQAYPETEFKIVKCNMSDFQYKSYLTSLSNEKNFIRGSFKDVDILNLPQNFFLGPRMISNISFPNKSIGEIGFSSFKGENLKIQNIKIQLFSLKEKQA
jgi:nucleoside-triphosphatase THEP1